MYRLTDKQPLVLRQPPPPIRPHKCGSPMNGTNSSTLSKTKEEHNTENCSSLVAQARPFFFRRCKRRKMLITTNIESLPNHVVFEILVRVPAEDIYNNTRLVCRKWCKIIHSHDFIHAHLGQSSCGILAQFSRRHPIVFLASGKGDLIEKSKLNYFFTQDVLSSCNGLVLELYDNHRDLCVTNPVTKQNFALPRFVCSTLCIGYAIAYAATSMEYKVVRPFFGPSLFDPRTESQYDCVAILTVGVDKDWLRRVKTRHLSSLAKNLILHQRPLTTEGFVHWAQSDSNSEYVLTLNIETEIISQFPAPRSFHDSGNELINNYYYYLPMGSYLSLLIARSKFSWEFWEMKPETGEWTKKLNIDLEADQFAGYLNCFLVPGGWLKFREVLVFNLRKEDSLPNLSFVAATHVFFAFNVCTRDIQRFELNVGLHHFLAHRNSLVWMGGSYD